MFDKLQGIEDKLEKINSSLCDPEVVSNQEEYKKLMREAKTLTPASAAHIIFFKGLLRNIKFLRQRIFILLYFTLYLRFRQALLSVCRQLLHKNHKIHKMRSFLQASAFFLYRPVG